MVYAKQNEEVIVRVPVSVTVVKKAVQEYERYVWEVKQKLFVAFMEKCGEHNVSENLARRVLAEYGLPDIRR